VFTAIADTGTYMSRISRPFSHHWRWAYNALPREDSRFGFHRRSEDAFFVSPTNSEGSFTFGLADGVGGLRARGADPAVFANRLMSLAAKHAGVVNDDPYRVLSNAAADLAEERVAGGATALITHVSHDGKLHAENLGDIMLLVARADGTGVTNAKRGLIAFDTPMQIGAVFDGGPPLRFDSMTAAIRFDSQLEIGSWIIAATDGLTDNLFPGDIAEMLRMAAEKGDEPKDLARALLISARTHAKDRMRDSPFALLAKDNDIVWTKGGRPDDITVLVARLMKGGSGDVRSSDFSESISEDSALRKLIPVNCTNEGEVVVENKYLH
jgi:protein phosphatase PTC7